MAAFVRFSPLFPTLRAASTRYGYVQNALVQEALIFFEPDMISKSDQRQFFRRGGLVFFLLLAVVGGLLSTKGMAGEAIRRVTAEEWKARQQTWVNAHFDRIELMTALRLISEQARVNVLLDRRVDPEQVVRVDLKDMTAHRALGELAGQSDFKLIVLGQTYFLTDDPRIDYLLKQIEDVREVLKTGSPPGRVRALTVAFEKTQISWEDFESYEKVVSKILKQGRMRDVGELTLLPYDLLAEGALVDVSPLEGLMLMLFEAELTLHVEPGGGSGSEILVQLVRLETLEELQQRFADRGLKKPADQVEKSPRKVVPLSQREFTLHVERARVKDIFQVMVDSGIEIVISESIDEETLSKPIVVKADRLKVDAFLELICRPVGLGYRIEEERIDILAGE